MTLQADLQRLSGTTLDAQGAANVWAGTVGLELVGALNTKAGLDRSVWLELDGVLAYLMGTAGLAGDGTLASAANVIDFPGTTGNYLSTPDSVLNSVTGDIDIRVKAALDDWTPAATNCLLGKSNVSGTARSYYLEITNGVLNMQWSVDGTAVIQKQATAAVGFVDGTVGWVRATLDVDNGTGGNDVKFYASSDGITWAQLGATVTTAGVTSIFDSISPVEIGARGGGNSNPLAGKVYYVEVRSGIDGPIVARYDSSAVVVAGAQAPATTPGWTLNGSALSKRDDYIRLPGTVGNYLSWPDTAANPFTGDLDVRIRLSMDDWTPATDQSFIGQYNSALNARGWRLSMVTGGTVNFTRTTNGLLDGSHLSAGYVAAFVDGSPWWIRATHDVDNGSGQNVVRAYDSPDGVTWTLRATTTTAGVYVGYDAAQPIEIGAITLGTVQPLAGNVYYAEVRNGIDGPVAVRFDARDITTPWTINGTGWNWQVAALTVAPTMALSLPGTTGEYASTPDAPGLSVVGDIDIRARVTLASWTPTPDGVVLGKWLGYALYIRSTGQLQMGWHDGTTGFFKSSGAATGFAAGSTHWVRGTLDVDNGASGSTARLYTSEDGVTWTQLGADQVTAGVTSITDSTAAVVVGMLNTGGSGLLPGATIRYAEVRNGINGPIVARFDPSGIVKTATRVPTTLTSAGTPNLLSPNQASVETNTTGFNNNTNCTLARSTAQALDGAASLEITAAAIGISLGATLPGTSGIPVVPGKSYTARASMRAAVTGRATRVGFNWYTAAGAYLSTNNGTNFADVTTGWAEGSATFVAPATAAFAQITFGVVDAAQALGEVHYVDRISLVETPVVWTVNGSAWDWVAG